MNILDNPKSVIIIGDNNNIGNDNKINSNKVSSCSSCSICAELELLKKRLCKLQGDIKVKDILIEHLTNE